jgi:transglutaminase-like putative cysteine protease
MLFQIRHTTRFKYEQPVYESHNELRMRPLEGPRQRCLSFGLEIDPPGTTMEYQDFYGNSVHALSVFPPHGALAIVARSMVERLPELDDAAVAMTFREFLARDSSRNRLEYDFLNPSNYVPFSDPLRKFFWMVHPANDEDVFEYVQRVVVFVRGQFEYEPGRTQVHSTADEILTIGGGVCQDFAHLTIGVLRLAGVPARYVSGYLAPTANSASVARAASSASHAWLEAQVPLLGWVGFDPTHGCRTDCRHIRVAIGRDYEDVSPIKGVFRTAGGEQQMTVELEIDPADSAQSGPPGYPGQSQSQQ